MNCWNMSSTCCGMMIVHSMPFPCPLLKLILSTTLSWSDLFSSDRLTLLDGKRNASIPRQRGCDGRLPGCGWHCCLTKRNELSCTTILTRFQIFAPIYPCIHFTGRRLDLQAQHVPRRKVSSLSNLHGRTHRRQPQHEGQGCAAGHEGLCVRQ